ncbi:MAG: histone family protein nucleoid-structuring protein [Herminiimonas sp.]|nr:histone family protein nucleoid-structuring protein [Herminiimonas sp.]
MTTYSELQLQIEALQRQAEQVRQNEVSTVVADIEAKMQEYGITVDDLVGPLPVNRKILAHRPAQAKYLDPSTGMTWSGRGRKPKWLVGKEPGQFRIK